MIYLDEPWWVMVPSQICPRDCRTIGCNNPECARMINTALLGFEPRISEAAGLRIIERIRQRLFRLY